MDRVRERESIPFTIVLLIVKNMYCDIVCTGQSMVPAFFVWSLIDITHRRAIKQWNKIETKHGKNVYTSTGIYHIQYIWHYARL